MKIYHLLIGFHYFVISTLCPVFRLLCTPCFHSISSASVFKRISALYSFVVQRIHSRKIWSHSCMIHFAIKLCCAQICWNRPPGWMILIKTFRTKYFVIYCNNINKQTMRYSMKTTRKSSGNVNGMCNFFLGWNWM